MGNSEKWQQQLDRNGLVTIGTETRNIWWSSVAMCLYVAGVGYYKYTTETEYRQAVIIVLGGLTVLFLASLLMDKRQHGHKLLRIDRDGITTFEGTTVAWADVREVTTVRNGNGEIAAQISLTPEGWRRMQTSSNTPDAREYKTYEGEAPDQAVLIPDYIDACPHELATWLNQFVISRASA